MDRLIVTSGKMVLLDKLVRRLRASGHRVLVFSQVWRRARARGGGAGGWNKGFVRAGPAAIPAALPCAWSLRVGCRCKRSAATRARKAPHAPQLNKLP